MSGKKGYIFSPSSRFFLQVVLLGFLYYFWNRAAVAEPFAVKALEGSRRVFGNRHPETLKNMSLLGSVYMPLNRREADDLLTTSWKTACQILGPKHEDTLLYGCVLGVLRFYQDRLEEAEKLLTQAFDDDTQSVS